ncbi:acyltransferase family protein [Alteromonas facilis]|uniref:acyltransferase family protein n=1 Tax=Alteromonas facilis TaxID=2048004 RepID=UPI000C2860C9|nr:DUF5009 domain-containing protein [Alteromonas facilis]
MLLSSIKRHCDAVLARLPKHRMLTIDVFRGIAITAMILVNNPGSWQYVYAPLRHAEWHGLTPTDLVFPFFIITMGIAIGLTFSADKVGGNRAAILIKVGKRTLTLFVLGLLLAVFYYNVTDPHFNWWKEQVEEIRILGVLQRLALVYAACAVLALLLNNKQLVAVSIALLVGYSGLLLYMPYGLGADVYVGELLMGNNYAAYIDQAVLGRAHLYYADAQPFATDPEGILSTFPAVVSGLIGVVLGRHLVRPNTLELIQRLWLIGILLTLVGWGMDRWMPINKALWSASFVLVTAGLALLFIAALHTLIDKHCIRRWSAPFIVFGANSLLFFMFSGVLARITVMIPVGDTTLKGALYSQIFQPAFGNYFGSLMYACVFLMVSYAVFYGLYKRGIFWKV